MAYLAYSEYTSLGGTVSSSDFTNLELKARRKLDYFTQNRLQNATTIISEVKECMVEFIDRMANTPLNGNLTSYDNGIESINFAENQTKALDNELYQLAIEYLPVELISAYVDTAEV